VIVLLPALSARRKRDRAEGLRRSGHRGTAAHRCRSPAVPGATTPPVKVPTPRSARLRPNIATRRSMSRSLRLWRP
jgi:hypothetical protein